MARPRREPSHRILTRRVPWLVAREDYGALPDSLAHFHEKYIRLRRRVIEEGIVREEDMVTSDPVEYRDLLLAHDREYVEDFMNLRTTPRTMFAGLPLTRDIREVNLNAAGGTMTCANLALDSGISLYLGGGLIHAHRGHADAFCFVNDVALALVHLKFLRKIERGASICCDAHHPDGVAEILAEEPDLFTLSIFQGHGYPYSRVKGDWDIGVSEDIRDEDYVELVESSVRWVIETRNPEILIYVAGVDPYTGDLSSDLSVSQNALEKRDRAVLDLAWENRIPIAVLVSAGGMSSIEDSVNLRLNTVKAAKEIVDRGPKKKKASRSSKRKKG
jgi:acetoin utilization deacetylase AcuC-like enzyme